MKRSRINKAVELKVMTASRRRCCLCVYLDNCDRVRKGQISHLNHDASDSKFENLVFLCFEHHDEYDSRTSQSKGLREPEVRHWRDKLYARHPKSDLLDRDNDEIPVERVEPPSRTSGYDKVIAKPANRLNFLTRPWRFPLWQVANQPDFFAYKTRGGMDGICLIERIDLPDGRIVVVCIQMPGNPGQSITNCVETLCIQVCERFDIPAENLVWIEHYEALGSGEWNLVTFSVVPPHGQFTDPKWTPMTTAMWEDLRLRPKARLRTSAGQFQSKIIKRFMWPTRAIQD